MTVLQLADVKPYLGKDKTTDDPDLLVVIAAAEASFERAHGPLLATTVTVDVPGSGTTALCLPVLPVRGVTSVTGKSGSVVTVDRVSTAAAVVYSESAFSEDYYTVVYQAGWADVAANLPADVREIVALEVQFAWQSRTGQVKRGPDDLRSRIDAKKALLPWFGFA